MAARGLNKVMLIGRLGADPEPRTIGDGVTVLNLSLATSEKYKAADGTPVENTQWHRLVFWRKAAEIVSQYTKKGDQIYVEGKIEYRKWTDEATGNDNWVTEIHCDEFQFLSSNGNGNGHNNGEPVAAGVEDEDLQF